jgi:polyisoprenoid-binding protein YceI
MAALCLCASAAFSQKYFSKDLGIKFFSDTPMEKIEAAHKNASCMLDTKTGDMAWKVLIKGFLFKKSLMQEHFNENYMESDKFPNATFVGAITNLSEVKFDKDGTYNAKVKGKMNLHGVEKEIEVPGTLKVGGGKITVHADFMLACADYKISIPAIVKDNIAKEIKVTVDGTLSPKQ